MADIGLDYAGKSPGAAAVKAAGYQFVARYLSRYTSKVITQGEFQDMTSNGVSVVLVFEDYANQPLKGYNQGVADAQFAVQQAGGIGWPSNRPIYFACDFDISDAQKPIAAEYMRGAISILGLDRVGAYGGYWWIKYCAENGLAKWFWQAVAWSGGNQHPRNHLFQRLGGVNVGGTDCDINDARQQDYGQWPGGDMPTLIDEEGVRILGAAVLERWPQPVPVPTPPELMAHVGGDALAKLKEFWYSDEGKAANQWRADVRKNLNDLSQQVLDLGKRPTQAQLDDAVAAAKKAQETLKQLQDQQNQDQETGNSFLRWIGGWFRKNP